MAIESQGSKFEIETGSGVAKNISAILLGEVTTPTCTSHGMAKGDVVTFASIVGTTQLNGQTAMIYGVATDTFVVNIDSSGYGAWVSGGTATPATFTEVIECTALNGPTGSAGVIDTTHLQSTYKEFLMGLPDNGEFTIDVNVHYDDPGQQAMLAAREARTVKGFRVTDSDGAVSTFDGVVLGWQVSRAVDDKVSGTFTVKVSGDITVTP